MADLIERWISQSDERARGFLQEKLIVDATEEIAEHMEKLGMSRNDLAEKLKTGRSHISQILSGSRNMTLRTLADIAWALGVPVSVKLGEEPPSIEWNIPADVEPMPHSPQLVRIRSVRPQRVANAEVEHWDVDEAA